MCAESPASGARFVRRFCVAPDSPLENQNHCQLGIILHSIQSLIVTKNGFAKKYDNRSEENNLILQTDLTRNT
jgi:hypothetical protein